MTISPFTVLGHAVDLLVAPDESLEALVISCDDGPTMWMEYVRGSVGAQAIWGYWRLTEGFDKQGHNPFLQYSLPSFLQTVGPLSQLAGLTLPEFGRSISPDLIAAHICPNPSHILLDHRELDESTLTFYAHFGTTKEALTELVGGKHLLVLCMNLGQDNLPQSGVYRIRREDFQRVINDGEQKFSTTIRTGLNTPLRYVSLAHPCVGYESFDHCITSLDTAETMHTTSGACVEGINFARFVALLENSQDPQITEYRVAFSSVQEDKYKF